MYFKKLAIISVIALVVIGCVLTAGCTSNTPTSASNTTEDVVIGTWSLSNGTTVVFTKDYKGVMTEGENKVNFTWKKTTDGKYQVDNEKGEQVLWTLDIVKGTLTNDAGVVLSKQIQTAVQTTSESNYVGPWTFTNETGTRVVVMKADGTGYFLKISTDDPFSTRILSYDQFTWKKNADSTVTHTFKSGMNPVSLKYDSDKNVISDTSGNILNRMDPITGIWYAEGIDDITGKEAKFTTIFMNGGTGQLDMEFKDGTTKVEDLIWSKNPDSTYKVMYADGDNLTWTINQNNAIVSTDSGKISAQKKWTDSYYYLSVLGPWYNEKINALVFFNADGTYSFYDNNELNGEGTWEIPEFGIFVLHVKNGTTTSGVKIDGLDRTWTYNRVNDTFISQDGTVFVRPSGDALNLTMESFEPIIGTWGTKYPVDGEIADIVLYLRNDAGGYWMSLKDEMNYVISSSAKQNWEKTGNYKYTVTTDNEEIYTEVYNPVTDTLTDNNKTVYTRLDPIVGIWAGSTSSNDGGKTTTSIKSDGTGITTISYEDNGTAEISTLTWKKNSDGSYAINFSDGEKRTYYVAPLGFQLTSSSGTIKNKALLDTTFLISITGAWYNAEKNRTAVFNADGSGFYNAENGVSPFTWELLDIGKWKITYTDGKKADDGSSLKGKTYVWTFDRDNNVFTDGTGVKFTRPTESIKDRITLN